uniref:beta-N-acetylhexosaminidase n=1 Tax=Caenorhabditis tropicalis TaxID=1561998 RepID=A0A1I7UE65_9PELO
MIIRNKQLWFVIAIFAAFLLLVFVLTVPNQGSNYAFFEGGIDPRESRRFKNVIVHLDLKGAPPRVEYLIEFFKLLSRNYVDGVLIEYEDMFPYRDEIELIRRENHYSEEDIQRILIAAEQNHLEVIPLIQTFGHLEFLLKKPQFMHLSEDLIDLNTICISDEKSIRVVEQMILQIRRLHPNSTRIHIGSDEAYHVAEDTRCHKRMEEEKLGKSELKLKHIARIGKFAKETARFEVVFAWNDMFDKETEETIRDAKLNEYIVPVVWGYRIDVTETGYFPDGLFTRISNSFDRFYIASAFKGADGARQPFSNISRYLENQKSYVKLMDLHPKASGKVEGIFVTGWSRFNHFNALCELLPVSIPSLIVDLFYLNYQLSSNHAWKAMKDSLECDNQKHLRGILSEWAIHGCKFPGADVYEIIQHDWKRHVDRRLFGKKGLSSPLEILNKLKEALSPILFKTDVEEIFNQYLTDYHSILQKTSSLPPS